MQLYINHFIAQSDTFSNFLINSCKFVEKAELVMSLAKLRKLAVLNDETIIRTAIICKKVSL